MDACWDQTPLSHRWCEPKATQAPEEGELETSTSLSGASGLLSSTAVRRGILYHKFLSKWWERDISKDKIFIETEDKVFCVAKCIDIFITKKMLRKFPLGKTTTDVDRTPYFGPVWKFSWRPYSSRT